MTSKPLYALSILAVRAGKGHTRIIQIYTRSEMFVRVQDVFRFAFMHSEFFRQIFFRVWDERKPSLTREFFPEFFTKVYCIWVFEFLRIEGLYVHGQCKKNTSVFLSKNILCIAMDASRVEYFKNS